MSKTLSAKGRRHARNIERSAKRRASKEPCVAGTDKLIKNRGMAAMIVTSRQEQERKITAKRTQRRNFKSLSFGEKKLHSAAGRAYKTPGEYVLSQNAKTKDAEAGQREEGI